MIAISGDAKCSSHIFYKIVFNALLINVLESVTFDLTIASGFLV